MTTKGEVCSSCGGAAEPTARFCRHCGVLLAAEPGGRDPGSVFETAREGEHKQVTILCTDVLGSLAIAERIEAEDWNELMSGLFSIAADAIRRYGGTLSRFTGDGLMALFGAPLAQEDHASRAAHAALELRNAVGAYADALRRTRGLSFSVRVGLHSGQAVVSQFGNEPGEGYTAVGHAASLAERMEGLAEPGRIYLTGATAGLVDGLFDVRDLGFEVRGEGGVLPVHELVGPGLHRTRIGATGERGFTRFVGRDDAMCRLEQALERSAAGRGQVVQVLGEPGVGKSRLCHEFVARCRRRGLPAITWHGLSHLSEAPLLGLIENFRRVLGVRVDEPFESARSRIAGVLEPLDPKLRDDLPLLCDFLGVGPQSPLRERDVFLRGEAITRMTRRLAGGASSLGLCVVWVDDLQWIDATSRRMLEVFLESMSELRILLLLSHRADYSPGEIEAAERIELGPLDVPAAAELLGSLLGPDPSNLEVAGRVLDRARGNPFFIEEMVWSLVESGRLAGDPGQLRVHGIGSALGLPDTLRASLESRIDRVGASAKRVVYAAAVIGDDLGASLLRSVVAMDDGEFDAALEEVIRGGFLERVGDEASGRCRFSHPLLREAAYEAQMSEALARTHAAVATVLSSIDPARHDESAALIARHWRAAGDPLAAGRWMSRSARWLAGRRIADSLLSWREVVALLDAAPDDTARALAAEAHIEILELGSRVGLSEAEEQGTFTRGCELAADLRSDEILARLHGARAQIRAFAGDGGVAAEYAKRGLDLALRTGRDELVSKLRASLGVASLAAGRLRDVHDLAEAALGSPPDLRSGATPTIRTLDAYLVLCHAAAAASLGNLGAARSEIADVARVAEDAGERELLCLALAFSPVIAQIGGDDPAMALQHARRAVELAEDLASPFAETAAGWGLGVAEVLSGRFEEAEATLMRVLETVRERRLGLHAEAGMLVHLAEAALGRLDLARARALAMEAVAAAQKRGTTTFEIFGLLAVARIEILENSARADVTELLERARELIGSAELRSAEPLVKIVAAMAAAASGDFRGAMQVLAEAHAECLAVGAPGLAARLAPLGASAGGSP